MISADRKFFYWLIFFIVISIWFCIPHFAAQDTLKEACHYKQLENESVQCHLCPRRCVISSGERGFCRVRENRNGKLFSLVYARPCSINIDPVEKKPFFHFLPGSPAFSVATAGCNLRCLFCQNWQISQASPETVKSLYLSPTQVVEKVKQTGSSIIAYTYTEPVIFYEYMLDIAKIAKAQGIKNVLHSNGYINEEPLRELCKYIDAANIDLKGFSRDYYDEMCLGKLENVLTTLRILKEEGVWVEITNLLLPGKNDGTDCITKMCLWIKDNLGDSVPVHFSRFYPMHKLLSLPPTPVESLEKARKTALDCGLKYVYIGNVPGHSGESTYCPRCGNIIVKRSGYTVLELNLDQQAICLVCQEKISGVWR